MALDIVTCGAVGLAFNIIYYYSFIHAKHRYVKYQSANVFVLFPWSYNVIYNDKKSKRHTLLECGMS